MLKKLRISNRMSQRALSRATGISQGYICKLENGHHYAHSPTIRQIVILASALGANPFELTNWFLITELKRRYLR